MGKQYYFIKITETSAGVSVEVQLFSAGGWQDEMKNNANNKRVITLFFNLF